MQAISVLKLVGREDIEGLPGEFLTPVAEQELRPRVYLGDVTSGIHDDHGVGRKVEERAERFPGAFLASDIPDGAVDERGALMRIDRTQ